MEFVMIVEPDEVGRKRLEAVFQTEKPSFSYQITGRPEEALDILEHQKTDVLVCETSLSVLSGREFFTMAKMISPDPPVQLMKTVPVASFVILALIWTGSKNLSVFISFLVVYPMIHVNTKAGLISADRELLEMAEVFHIPFIRRALYIYRTALYPYLKSACRTALGMGFKSGIAAEVIGVPDGSIGEGLYLAKIYLSTAELFAWTVAIILVSSLFEKGFLWILKKCAGKGADVNESDK